MIAPLVKNDSNDRLRQTSPMAARRWLVVALMLRLSTGLFGAERTISLQDQEANLRDLGGLPASGGAVRSGLIYRSAALCKLTKSDVTTLATLHLHSVIDLRQAHEITPKSADNPALLLTVARALRLPLSAHGALSGRGYYQLVLRQHPQEVRRFFEALADPRNLPLLFHCAHGKDRTGVMAALLLLSLGTPRESITADYLESHATGAVHRHWIEAAYAEVDRAGGIGPFLSLCGVTPETFAHVRTNLVGEK